MKKKNIQSESKSGPFLTDPNTGLSSKQVMERMEQGLTNAVSEEISRTTGKIIRSNVCTYFNLIFFLLAAVLLYERSYNNLTFLGVVIANTAIGIVQELRSKRELEKLQLITEPESSVLRDSVQKRIPNNELVQDDIVILSAGNQICADAALCEGTLRINEALVTGEQAEVEKSPGDSLLSGSFVISGCAKARLTQVGDSAFAAKLSSNAKTIKKRQRPGMMKSLTILIQVIGVIIIPFAILMFWNQNIRLGYSERVSVENTTAAIIGMIPEGLYLLTSVALAASTIRLAKKDTLVHDMKCIETLARVDTICVDKTGTITQPSMELTAVLPVGERTVEEAEILLQDFAACMPADNETMKAIQGHFPRVLLPRRPLRLKEFSSQTKYSAVDFGKESYVLGAPEFLMRRDDFMLQSMVLRWRIGIPI